MTHFALDREMSLPTVVIVGAGHAGVQAAASLREEGFDGGIVLLSQEKDLPYQRPPLSKAFLKGEMDLHGLPLRAEAFFRDHRVDLRLGVRATTIDRAARRVETSDGDAIEYGHLILGDRSAASAARRAGRRSARRLCSQNHRRRQPRSASGSARGARSS